MSFSDYVQKQTMAAVELPLVHTTEYFHLPSIQATNTLQTSDCKFFKEPLLYFFYGRPAYRDSTRILPTRDVGFYPICFVFRPGTISKKAKRLYPFDTGASQSGLYEPAIKRADALAGYQVNAVVENARRIVAGFFETDKQYLSNTPRHDLLFSSTDVEAESYYRLINGGGDPTCDDRCSAIEIQIAECLDVRQGIMAIVLPTCFLEDDALRDTLMKVWRAHLLTYDADIGMRPIEFHSEVRRLVKRFYRRSRLL
ncbi:MAG TPA: hypothetical protein VKH81_11605 [Candidatus Angelobacter sp.]|nr:hypothetical protein [Candidatus Angelobacter sp.]